jgi:hypothetical protein
MDRITRRGLLEAATAVGAIAVAGCVAQPEDASGGSPHRTDPDPDDTTDETTDPDPDDTTDPGDRNSGDDTATEAITDTPGIDGVSIETIEARCGSPDEDGITVDKNAETVIINGNLPASNPCHEAVLEAGAVEDTGLSVVIDAADTTDEDEGCVTCYGTVSYRAEIELVEPQAAEWVRVNHKTGDQHAARCESTTDAKTPITSASLETIESDCMSGDSEEATVEFGDEAITVTGTLVASNPCHEAVFGPIALEDDHLSVVVDARSTREAGEICVDCVGAVAYVARIVPEDPAGVERVTVDHVTGTESTVSR